MKNAILSYVRKSSVRTKLLISYILLFTIPLLIIGIGGYRWISSTVGDYANKVYRSVLDKTITDNNAIFTQLNTVAEQLSNTTWVKKILSMQGNVIDEKRVDVWTKMEYQQSIYALKSAMKPVAELCVVFLDKNAVIASYGTSDLKFFAGNAFYIEGMDVSKWTDILANLKSEEALLLPSRSVDKFGVKSQGTVYIRPLRPNSGTKPNGVLIAYINQKYLEDSLKPLFIDKGIAVTIFGKDGAPFINLGDKSVESPLVISADSELTGWQYKMMIPQHLIVRNAEGVRNVILVSVGLLLLLCCALAFGFTRNIYRPVRELVAMVKSRVGDPCSKNTEDEYSWLQNGIHAMMEQEGTLILELKRQKPMLQEAWLGRLLTGEIYPKQEFEIALKLLDINMMLPLFRVCIITGQNTFRSADCNIQMETILRQLKMESDNGLAFHTYTATGQCVLVVNYDCEASLKRFVSRLIAAVPDTLIGIGNSSSSLEAVAKSYNEAAAALDYRSIATQENNIILFEDITIMKEKYYYPLDKEYCISNCLKSGNSRDAISMVNALLTENLKHSHNSQESIMNFLKNVELTALKAMDELGISSLLGRNRPEQFSSKNIVEIRGYIETLYQDICETILQRNASNSSLMQNIMQYVDESITNSALSLAMVADKFSVSVSYVSRVFTERFGVNFHHYINDKRIALAREQLLLKLDISSVARSVGYDSDVTFRRLFKQFVGLSPSEYRDQQKNLNKCING